MADLTPFLGEVRGIYTDRPRDRLPTGMVWDMSDFIPIVAQAGVRMRGNWTYHTSPFQGLSNFPMGTIYAPFRNGGRWLAATFDDKVSVIPTPTPGVPTQIATAISPRQNPVFHRDRVIIPAANGTSAARYITFDGSTYTETNAPATALTGRYAAVWKDRVLLAASAAAPTTVGFSKPGDPTAAWDSLSRVSTARDITGLAVLGNSILCLHASSIERLRGSIPPDSTLTDPTGDMILDDLADHAGCYDARSIAYWNENAIFCDARGITLTDGATVRNIIQQSGNLNLWQDAWIKEGTTPFMTAACVHRDYYIVTIFHNIGPFYYTTIVVDLPTRRVFRFENVRVALYAPASGSSEELYAIEASSWPMRLTDIFDPDNMASPFGYDGNGGTILPKLKTGFQSLTKGAGYKRVEEVHVTYRAATSAGDPLRISFVNTPISSPVVLGELPPEMVYKRRSMPVNRRVEGIAFEIEQVVVTSDTRLHDISVRAFAEDESRE